MSEQQDNTPRESNSSQTEQQNGKPDFLFMYIAIGCMLAGIVLFALSFFITGAGVYLIIASMISELASVSFLNAQKRKAYSTACKVVRVISYAVMLACVGVVIAGMVVTSTNK